MAANNNRLTLGQPLTDGKRALICTGFAYEGGRLMIVWARTENGPEEKLTGKELNRLKLRGKESQDGE